MYAYKVLRLLRVIPNPRLIAECEDVLSSNEQKLNFHADDRCIPLVLLVCRASYDVASQHYHWRKFVFGRQYLFQPYNGYYPFWKKGKGNRWNQCYVLFSTEGVRSIHLMRHRVLEHVYTLRPVLRVSEIS